MEFKSIADLFMPVNLVISSGHADTTGLNNSKSLQTFCMSAWRSHDSILGEVNYKKTDISGPFIGNTPFDNYGHIDGLCSEIRQMCDKANSVFLYDASTDSTRKIGLNKWSYIPRGLMLKIEEGEEVEDKIFKRNFEVKLEGSNKLFNKRKK